MEGGDYGAPLSLPLHSTFSSNTTAAPASMNSIGTSWK
jgi:hypothetical protein